MPRAMDRKFAFSSNKLSSFASISASRFGRPQNVVLPRSRSLKVNAAEELHFNKDGSAIRKLQIAKLGLTLGPKGRNVVLESKLKTENLQMWAAVSAWNNFEVGKMIAEAMSKSCKIMAVEYDNFCKLHLVGQRNNKWKRSHIAILEDAIKERKIMDAGPANWQKACFVPTKSDALVVGFRRWLNKYAGGEVDWKGKYSGALPPTPPREQLMDRYWSHVVNCRSCNAAHKGLNALEVVLQVASLAFVGIVAATKQNVMSLAARNTMIAMAVVCFAGSKLLAHFIYKNFHYHDYNHAFR
ncbi:hypothetical protein NC652_000123 [Populus alba x Populus x berolinensis]|nr:hypothetical protein NC652_000123 [Populus alba x Populus x berolinensis]